jgi:tRNA-2-methylthio-N6-dimethylallyladenosine synthase
MPTAGNIFRRLGLGVIILDDDALSRSEATERLRAVNDGRRRGGKSAPRYFVASFGCRMNSHDSEKIAGDLEACGFEAASGEDGADIVVYNTCCVRENAENRVFGRLGRLKKLKTTNKNLKIALCGCMTQQPAVIDKIRRSYGFVDVVIGTFNLDALPAALCRSIEEGRRVIDIREARGDIESGAPPPRNGSRRADVNVTFGCDNFCSYCVVPLVRGREVSRTQEAVIGEIESLAKSGVVEVTLLGQNVNSYGAALSPKVTFAELLRMAANTSGIRRARFMTSHPKDISDELIRAMAEEPNVCKAIHLPMQSGSDGVLERMNRKYTRDGYLSIAREIRAAIPGVSITTDIIVGFPGETEEDFQRTLSACEQVRFNGAFTFLYSKRAGTPAAQMDGQVPESVARERFGRLLATLNPIILEHNKAKIGATAQTLADSFNPATDMLTGRTDDFSLVHFKGSADLTGRFVNVLITGCKTFYLTGELTEERKAAEYQ